MPRKRNKEKQVAYKRAHYEKNKAEYKRKSVVSTKALRERNRMFLKDHLQKHPCLDCGEPDIVVLDFDHVQGEKIAAVTRMANQPCGLEALQQEMDKCEIRCANCHRRRTHERRQQAEIAQR